MKPWPSLAPYAKTLPMPGGDLFYYDTGSADSNAGKPTVVLIHGLGDEADTWRHVFPLLADAGYRLIAPDLPGFGRSLWKGRINKNIHRNAIIQLIKITGAASAECPAVFIGSSLGAGIAELIAVRQPEFVKALILIGGCFPFKGRVDKGMLFMGLPFLGRNWYRAFRTNHEGAWKSLYPYYSNLDAMNGEDKDFLRQRVIARVESPNQERGYFATLRSINAFFLFGMKAAVHKAKKIPGKILLLWGDRDHVFPQEKTDLFRTLRADAEFVLIHGAGHLPHQEKPEKSAVEMLRFIKEVL